MTGIWAAKVSDCRFKSACSSAGAIRLQWRWEPAANARALGQLAGAQNNWIGLTAGPLFGR